MKYYIKTRPHDNSVVYIRKAEDTELFHREQLLEVDENFDIMKYLISQSNGGEPNLFFVDGKLEIRTEKPQATKIKELQRKIKEIEHKLYLPNIFREVVETGGEFSDINKLKISRETEYEDICTELGSLIEAEQEHYTSSNNQQAIDRLNTAYTYNSAIVATAKDENPYIIEWIKHHLDLGIEHIFIRDDGSNTPIKETLSELEESYLSKVTVNEIQTPHPYSAQRVWYGNWVKEFEGKVKWACFLDIDEFINLNVDTNINDFLNSFGEDIGEINMGWVEYNANGQETKEDKPVVERFTKIAPVTPYLRGWLLGKYFVRPEVIERIRIHKCVLSEGFRRVSPDGDDVKVLDLNDFKSKEYTDPLSQRAYIAHYFTKSKEEWFEKIRRGACDNYCRKRNDFYLYNPEMLIPENEQDQKLN